jgi:tRNA dimethylallyltransferase
VGKVIRVAAIAGPTATGKTRLAVDIARELGSEIISVDSRQVYRGLDIGSGKDLEEYSRDDPPVRYHLIDVADPADVYTVFHYQRDCYAVLSEAAARLPFREKVPMVMAGGSGLYLEAVLRGFRIPDVGEDPELRARLMETDYEELVKRLRRESAELAARTDRSSKKRVIRALEIAAGTRHGPPAYSEPPPVRIEGQVFVIEVERRELQDRIDRRLDERLAGGLVEEVRGLLDKGVPPERLTQLGLEYREATLHLEGVKNLTEMRNDLRRGIHQFAKRQQTWFRGMKRRGLSARIISPGDRDSVLKHITG